jgi:hypothetical protein
VERVSLVINRRLLDEVRLGFPDWPLNVFSDEDAAAELSILRAIASSDLHNLVYRADDRIVPPVTVNSGTLLANGAKTT